jgi:septal ring factor EnvC (AmiA/AmiB activator)
MLYKAISLLIIFFVIVNAHAKEKREKLEDEVIKRKEKLRDLDKQLKETKEEITKVEQKELSTVNQLNAIDKKLSANQSELKRLNRKLEKLKKDVLVTDDHLNQMNQDIAARKKLFTERLLALYKYKRSGGILRTIFSSQSYLDLSQRTKFIVIVLNQDREHINHFLEQLALTKEKKAALEDNRKSLEKTKNSIVKKKSQINKQKKEKSALLEKTRKEKKLYMAAVKELEKSSQELQSLIDGLKEKLTGTKGRFIPSKGKRFATLKGKLPLPLSGKILSTYGKKIDPKLNTVLFQKGIEIAAQQGEEIKAIHEGKILYADWFKGYGNIVIVDHGDSYYSLSAHLSQINKRVGDRVEAGEVIALSGDTGSLKGPCLYFELRHHGEPLDPSKWLRTP